MIFGGRPLQELKVTDFEALIQNHTPEGPDLEYKEQIYGGHDGEIREMLRDISAIANAEGGYLIMGIREDTLGRAESFSPIQDVQRFVQPINQSCLDGIRDRLEGFEVRAIETSTNEGIIVVRIPASNQRPHMVTRDNRTDFYRRYGTDKRSMTLEEIRSLVLTNPAYHRLIELELLASGKFVPRKNDTRSAGIPYVRIYTESSVEHFLQKYLSCNAYPQTLVIVSPFISDLIGELVELKDLVDKITADKTATFIITRPSKEIYQQESISILNQSPYIEIRHNELIHAKLFICWCRKQEEESFALFGSGNLTQGGLRRNLELGMMIYSHDYGRSLVRELFEWSTVGLRSQSKRIKSAVRI